MAQVVAAGVLLAGEDCARLDGLLLRALADTANRNGGVPVQVARIAAEIHRAADEFRTNILVNASSGTPRDEISSVKPRSPVTDRLTVQEAAKLAEISEEYARRMARKGVVNATKSGHRGAWLVDSTSLAAWVAERERRRQAA
jgi:excisionase family DNA binding protein